MKTALLTRLLKTALLTAMLLFPAFALRAESNLASRFHAQYYETVADELYLTREIPKNLDTAIAYYKKAIAAQPHRPGVHWKITRCYWVLAKKRASDDNERLQHLKEGIRFGKIAIETDRTNSNAYLWNALVHGESAIVKGVMNTIYMRTQILEWLETAVRLNPENVNAVLGLAGWYYHIPELFGGNKIRTFRLIEQAEAIDPDYTAIYLQKAQFLISEKRFSEAVSVLRKMLTIESPTLPNDSREDKAISRKLLAELNKAGHRG